MSDFGGMDDLLQDFLQEARELLSDVDNKLVDLERVPNDKALLNDIFRGFHTIKGGAGFLNATELVTLCHLTENLFDRLRNGELKLTPEIMDVIMEATRGVRDMFGELGQRVQPQPAPAAMLDGLRAVLDGQAPPGPSAQPAADGPDWQAMHAAVTGAPTPAGTAPAASASTAVAAAGTTTVVVDGKPAAPVYGRRATDRPGAADAFWS